MRIDILEPQGSQYRVLQHFSLKLFEAMQRKGVNCRYISTIDGSIHLNWKDLPDCTIGFNGVPCSGETSEMLCDQIATPHLAILVDPPTWHYPLTASPFTILSCDDRSGNRFLDSIPYTRHFFLPHAVEKDIPYNPHEKKLYDISLLATYINFDDRREKWQKMFPDEVCRAMDAAIELTFSVSTIGFMEALQQSLIAEIPTAKEVHFSTDPNFLTLAREVELYIKGKERVDLIRAIKGPEVHIFGASIDKKDWQKELVTHANVHFHPPVSYEEAFKIMRQSKIILNTSMKNKEGAHERIFMGLGSGAAVVSNDCPFMREQFVEGEEIILYDPANMNLLNEQLITLLNNEHHLNAIAQAGRINVLENHTWDQRVDTILESLPLILDEMPSTS